MAVIVKISQKEQEEVFLKIYDKVIVLGRSKSADYKLLDPMCSGKHCELYLHEGQLTFKDLGSTNGSFINDSKILNGHLYINDILKIGSTEIQIVEDKLSKHERLAHTRDAPKTRLTYISIKQETKTGAVQDAHAFNPKDAHDNIDSLYNKNATHVISLEKKDSPTPKVTAKKETKVKKEKKKSFWERLFSIFKKN